MFSSTFAKNRRAHALKTPVEHAAINSTLLTCRPKFEYFRPVAVHRLLYATAYLAKLGSWPLELYMRIKVTLYPDVSGMLKDT